MSVQNHKAVQKCLLPRHVQSTEHKQSCLFSVNLNLKSLSTRSYVWRRLFALNIQPKLRQRRPMSGSKSSKSSISLLLSSRIYIQVIPAKVHVLVCPPLSIQESKIPKWRHMSGVVSSLRFKFLIVSNPQQSHTCCWPPNLKTQNEYSNTDVWRLLSFFLAKIRECLGIFVAQDFDWKQPRN